MVRPRNDPQQQKIKDAENKKKWAEKNPKQGKITAWKQKHKLVNSQGDRLTIEEWKDLYDRWIVCEKCECCGKTFNPPVKNKPYNDKQLDHCHKTKKQKLWDTMGNF